MSCKVNEAFPTLLMAEHLYSPLSDTLESKILSDPDGKNVYLKGHNMGDSGNKELCALN